MKYVLIIVSIIVIIITLVLYFKLCKEIKNNEQISRDYLVKKVNSFSVLLFILFIMTLISVGSNIYRTINTVNANNDINKYEYYLNEYIKNDDVHSRLEYFPKEIDKDKVLAFGEFNRSRLFDAAYFIYLDYQYDDIASEIDKITDISIKTVTNKDSNDTIYVISDDGKGTMEYVLVNDNDNTVIYVFNQLFKSKDIDIDEKYFIE